MSISEDNKKRKMNFGINFNSKICHERAIAMRAIRSAGKGVAVGLNNRVELYE